MKVFSANRGYQAQLDVRFSDGKAPDWAGRLINGEPPNAHCWLVVMPRRGGKTWLAKAIETARDAQPVRYVDLRDNDKHIGEIGLRCLITGRKPGKVVKDETVLVDEPGLAGTGSAGVAVTGGVDPTLFVAGLRALRAAGEVPIVFASPQECAVLLGHLGVDGKKDVLVPPLLNDDEVARMAARADDWAPAVVARIRDVDPSWLGTPYLLELLLEAAEDNPSLRYDAAGLIGEAQRVGEQYDYLSQVFHNGLSTDQRAALRQSRWRAAGIEVPEPPAGSRLDAARLLDRTPVPQDPMIAHHLPEILRIHHISDLHHGGGLRQNVDAKDRSKAGRKLAVDSGAGTPLTAYLDHVQQLAVQHRAPHLVIVTGDVVNRPNDVFGADAIAWLQQLGEHLAEHRGLQSTEPQVVLVGGNHDVSWELGLDPDPLARHRWFADTFAKYPHPDLNRPPGADRRLFVEYPGVGLRIAMLGSAESGGELASDADRQVLEELCDEITSEADEATIQRLIAATDRIDPGVVSRDMLNQLAPEAGFVTLAALHHPLSPVPSVEIAPYSGIVNAGQAKQALSHAHTSLVLHGHTHQSFLTAERLLGDQRPWTMRIAGAATLAAETTTEQNGYNEVFLAREGEAYALLIRPVRFEGGQWRPQPAVAFRPGEPNEEPLVKIVADLAEHA